MEEHSLNADQEDGWDETIIKCFDNNSKIFNRFTDIYNNRKEFSEFIKTIFYYARYKDLLDIEIVSDNGHVLFKNKDGIFFSVWLDINHGN